MPTYERVITFDTTANRPDAAHHANGIFFSNDDKVLYWSDGDNWHALGRKQEAGQATFSGDGSTATFSVDHGLGETPNHVIVTARSADASGDQHVSNLTSTTFDVTFGSAPSDDTDNVVLDYIAVM